MPTSPSAPAGPHPNPSLRLLTQLLPPGRLAWPDLAWLGQLEWRVIQLAANCRHGSTPPAPCFPSLRSRREGPTAAVGASLENLTTNE